MPKGPGNRSREGGFTAVVVADVVYTMHVCGLDPVDLVLGQGLVTACRKAVVPVAVLLATVLKP